ncbi:Crp/Fnr family transcriptional regulator [Enterococcus hermanniensis]|uniref:Cyclic nucleotide-binding domain-containing protein n=1 Tax=Enterococcus hermanniensis TaxID=249189 RepID=A0A1L8TR71_9ENTE|nr:cyclic nucleotide-binding domain-containing protein [Enterococcus hermanniensis]OJG46554.1 hypothetical protein RV04_GL000982 [Enterococcus hermanniensis]
MFEKLEPHHLELLDHYGLLDHQTNCRICFFNSGDTVFAQGTIYKYIMIVVSGKAKVCTQAPNGKDLVLTYYLSNGLIGNVELMSNTNHAIASVIALSSFECIMVPFENNQDSMFSNLTFITQLAKDLSENLISSAHSYSSNALYSGEERLCSYIIHGAYKNYFFDNLTDVAATIGVSYRHLFRLLNRLCDEGILARDHKGFKIIDRKQLMRHSSEAEK